MKEHEKGDRRGCPRSTTTGAASTVTLLRATHRSPKGAALHRRELVNSTLCPPRQAGKGTKTRIQTQVVSQEPQVTNSGFLQWS